MPVQFSVLFLDDCLRLRRLPYTRRRNDEHTPLSLLLRCPFSMLRTPYSIEKRQGSAAVTGRSNGGFVFFSAPPPGVSPLLVSTRVNAIRRLQLAVDDIHSLDRKRAVSRRQRPQVRVRFRVVRTQNQKPNKKAPTISTFDGPFGHSQRYHWPVLFFGAPFY